MSNKRLQLEGLTFDTWYVIKINEELSSKNKISYFDCKCKLCGRVQAIKGTYLNNNKIIDCECNKKQRNLERRNKISESRKKENKYIFPEGKDYCFLCFNNSLEKVKIDLKNYELVSQFYWFAYKKYARAHLGDNRNKKGETRENLILHRLIYFKDVEVAKTNGTMKDKIVDHINRNTYDCTENNLRICSPSENAKNTSTHKNNTSGVSGVCYNKRENKWIARIGYNYKRINLGRFDTKEEAIKTRLIAEKEYYGEYAPQKELFSLYL